jgi:site-specific recombinase XerD
MSIVPKPLFETYESFLDQDFSVSTSAVACVREYLASFADKLHSKRGYLAVRLFLRSYSDNSQTFNSYRTQIERLLLWALIVQQKPLHELKRQDAEDYLAFCRNPPRSWVGPVIRGRFVANNDDSEGAVIETLMANPNWRPFSQKTAKHHLKDSADSHAVLEPTSPDEAYSATPGTMNQVYSICGRFFEFLAEDAQVSANPFRLIKKKLQHRDRPQEDAAPRALTPLQWDYVLETAEHMALGEPERHERTLFLLATLFAMYLRVSDIVGRTSWRPSMGDFRQDPEGNWWFHVVGKGNKVGKIAVRDEYIEQYLTRYRTFLGLPALPQRGEKTPLITTLSGRSGLSDRQVRALLQAVFDNAVVRMRAELRADHEMEALKTASVHWLRHTSATFDAPFRNAKDLQFDLRHSNLSTTQNTYYHSHDQERAHSIKRIGMRDRG